MTALTIAAHDLPSRFDEVLSLLQQGQEVEIVRHAEAKPVLAVRLKDAVEHPTFQRRAGEFKGVIEMKEGFDDPLEEFEPYQ